MSEQRRLVKKIVSVGKPTGVKKVGGLVDPAAANPRGGMDVWTKLQQQLALLETQIAIAPKPTTYSTGAIQDARSIHKPESLPLSREGPWDLEGLELWAQRRAALSALLKLSDAPDLGHGPLGISETSAKRGKRVAKVGPIPNDSWAGSNVSVAKQMGQRAREFATEPGWFRPGLRVRG